MSTEQNLNTAVNGGSELNVQLDTANAQIGISAGADFENNTWTFELPAGFKAGAGEYMIVKITPNANIKSMSEGSLFKQNTTPEQSRIIALNG